MTQSASTNSSRLPFPPGESPFHVRGLNYTGLRDYCTASVPGGIPAVLNRLQSDSLRRFFDQTFLAVTMYDALPIAPITMAIAAQEGRSYDDSIRLRAGNVAQRDMSGIYRRLMRLVSPELAIQGLSRLWGRYFNFGRIDILESAPRHWEINEVGIPAPLAPWFALMSPAYLTTIFDLTGAQGTVVRIRSRHPAGKRDGVDLVTLRIETTWQL